MSKPLKSARQDAGLTQHQAAARLGVSQPYYSQLENGARPLPPHLMAKLVSDWGVSPVNVPLPPLSPELSPLDENSLASALANLGYPGFAHLRDTERPKNPAEIVARALVHRDLDVRIVEGLPWLLATFVEMDWQWLVAQCRLLNLQNRLGFLLELASQLEKAGAERLEPVMASLEGSKLAAEDTLCYASMPLAERRWTLRNRPHEAARWNVATTISVRDLTHAT